MRSLCADMEVLYWKHVREQLETLRKLQKREVNTDQSAPPTPPGFSNTPHTCSRTGG